MKHVRAAFLHQGTEGGDERATEMRPLDGGPRGEVGWAEEEQSGARLLGVALLLSGGTPRSGGREEAAKPSSNQSLSERSFALNHPAAD